MTISSVSKFQKTRGRFAEAEDEYSVSASPGQDGAVLFLTPAMLKLKLTISYADQ